jgi:long-chain acyl-CoA synthetase
MKDLQTLVDVFNAAVEHDRSAAMAFRSGSHWQDLSARDLYQRVMNVARALQGWGLSKGDRVAILSENRPEWAIADFACLMLGLVDVPIYTTLLPDQIAFALNDSGCRAIFVSNRELLEKVLSIKDRTRLEKIILMDQAADSRAISMTNLMLSAAYTRHPDLEAIGAALRPDDLATIIYTSGTTGDSKGVMLTHYNICSNLTGTEKSFQWRHGDGYVSFLPLCHITARHVDYIMFVEGVRISYCGAFDLLPQILKEVRPANFVSVPRVYEKIRQEAERRTGTGVKKKIFQWALRVGRAHRGDILSGKIPSSLSWKLANAFVYSKIRAAIGGRAERCISGGAPLGKELGEWFADMGIRIFEGYGLTETSPVIAINTREHYRLGTVGRPVSNVECKLAEDGELLVRGPSVFPGYWHAPEKTAEAFVDGWFRTGDIATIDADGFVSITDRKKDLIKTSGGKFIAPQPIENSLKTNVLIAHAAVIGDKRRFACVIIAPNFPLLEDWARERNVAFSSRTELIAQPQVRALYDDILEQVNKNLARFEQLKRAILVPDEFQAASGELTPSLKLKRRVVEARYAAQIEAVYASHEHVSA